MELLKYPKTEYLLDASLGTLHEESLAWLKELAFWAEEISFFYKLVHTKKFSGVFPSPDVAEIDQELVRLHGEKLEKLRSGVASHEQLLASVYRSASLAEEQVYREAHKKLLSEIFAMHEEIRTFKRKLFSFAGR